MLMGMWAKENPYTLWVEMQTSPGTIEISTEMYPWETSIDLTYDPAIPFRGIHQSQHIRDTCTLMFVTALVT